MAENRSVVTTTALFKLLLKFYDGTPCRKLIRHRYSRTITVRSNTHLCQHQPHWKISNGWASFARRVSKQRKHWSVKEFVTDRNKLLHINFSNYTKRRLRWHFTDLAVTTLTTTYAKKTLTTTCSISAVVKKETALLCLLPFLRSGVLSLGFLSDLSFDFSIIVVVLTAVEGPARNCKVLVSNEYLAHF